MNERSEKRVKIDLQSVTRDARSALIGSNSTLTITEQRNKTKRNLSYLEHCRKLKKISVYNRNAER